MTVARRTIGLALCGALAVGVTACGSSGDSGGGRDAGSIRIGLVTQSSGTLAVFGDDSAKGWKLAADEVNAKGGVDGRKVQIFTSQTDGTPSATLRAIRRQVTENKVQVVAGPVSSAENGAIQKQLASLGGAILINALGQDDVLTGASCNAAAFRTVQSSSMGINTLAATLKRLPQRSWAIQATDYVTGRGAATAFTAAAKAAGKSVTKTVYSPIGTTEFGSNITQLRNSGAEGLFVAEFGSDAVAFVKQSDQFKLFDRFRTVVGFNMVTQPVLKPMGDAVEGFYNNLGYDVHDDNPLNAAFVAAFQKRNGVAPYYVPADAYIGAQGLFAAVRKARSSETAKIRAALSGLSFDSIVGRVSFRAADHQLLRPSYLARVEKQDGVLGFKVVATAAPDVSSPAPDPACKL